MYMSPEQIKSTKDVTAQSDIYSLGVVLWQMVTGKKPYDINTTSTFELETKIVNEKLVLTNTLFRRNEYPKQDIDSCHSSRCNPKSNSANCKKTYEKDNPEQTCRNTK